VLIVIGAPAIAAAVGKIAWGWVIGAIVGIAAIFWRAADRRLIRSCSGLGVACASAMPECADSRVRGVTRRQCALG